MAFNYFLLKSRAAESAENPGIGKREAAIRKLTSDLTPFHPRAVLLFGSMAKYLSGHPVNKFPGDADVVMVGNNVPFGIESVDYGCDIELHLFKTEEMIGIAKTLRYDAKPIALSKLYSKVVLKNHSRDIIAACLLLGPGYPEFGIEQIEIDGLIDTRDYSAHKVFHGEKWWRYLSAYARERRRLMQRFSDKMVGRYEFEEWKKIRIACDKGNDTACMRL